MRIMDATLLQKLNENLQVSAADAEPRLRVVATQATTNTLLTEIIHEDEVPTFGDVAIRQLAGEKSPTIAYAICVDAGVATVYERQLPAMIDHPWVKLFTLGSATDVAMEFNGTWEVDTDGQCHYLETEQTPYIFLVNNGVLTVQKWMDVTTQYELATDVVHVSAVRAWKSSDEPLLDQGLMAVYTKADGSVHYRALAELTLGELSWDLEQDVPQLATGNVSVQVFRTNDFRFGILCERSAGGFQYILSKRTYAGQSVKPEAVYAQVRDVVLTYRPIQYKDASDGAHYMDTEVPGLAGYVGYYKTQPVLTFTPETRPTANSFLVTTNLPLIERLPLARYVGISIDAVLTTLPAVVSAVVDDRTILVTTDIDISPWQEVTLTFYTASSLRYRTDETSYLLAETTTVVFSPEAAWDDRPQMAVGVTLDTLSYVYIQYSDCNNVPDETLTACVDSVAVTVTQVGPVPV